MRSLRIDQGYRAIVLKPEHGEVHMLLWADKHDDAYKWAERHECRINAETGALQVYEPRTAPEARGSRRRLRRRPTLPPHRWPSATSGTVSWPGSASRPPC